MRTTHEFKPIWRLPSLAPGVAAAPPFATPLWAEVPKVVVINSLNTLLRLSDDFDSITQLNRVIHHLLTRRQSFYDREMVHDKDYSQFTVTLPNHDIKPKMQSTGKY